MRNRLTTVWTGKNSKAVFSLLEKIGDELILVYDGKRSKGGLSSACTHEGYRTGRIIKLVNWTNHVALVRFEGMV
jgi:hypothetical protein